MGQVVRNDVNDCGDAPSARRPKDYGHSQDPQDKDSNLSQRVLLTGIQGGFNLINDVQDTPSDICCSSL